MTDSEMSLFDVMFNCRAMRRLSTREVPEDLLTRLVEAGNQAPSGSNTQGARWIIVRDAAQKAKLAELNRVAVEAYASASSGRADELPHQSAAKRERMLGAVLWQKDHLHEVPAIILACMDFGRPIDRAAMAGGGGSIWPGVQNLLLAARALGLGATPTTLALQDPSAVAGILDLPPSMGVFCLIPVGYPLGKFGPVTRKPVDEVLRFDRWS
jgi:nitroreductase